MSRYNNRRTGINSSEQYLDVLDKRGVNSIEQYRTPEKEVFEQEVYDSVSTVNYTWTYGDSYWRLASFYYGDSRFWYVIASFNKRPTESHNKIGDVLKIPISLADALQVVS